MSNQLTMLNHKKYLRGFSLIEVMIFVSILGIVFIITIGYVINLLRTMKVNEHKVMATYYAEELREWLKSEKEADWDAFSQKAGFESGQALGTHPITYCFNNDIDINDTIASMGTGASPKYPAQACASYNGIGVQQPLIFKREVILSKDKATGPTSIEAKIIVSWIDNGTVFEVPLNAKFTVWE